MTLTLEEKNKIKEVIIDLQTSEHVNLIWVNECRYHKDKFDSNAYQARRAIDRLSKLVGWPIEYGK